MYKDPNLIEHFFRKTKHFWHIATQYGKLAIYYLGFLNLIATIKWLK
ncbi:MAG: hypothetical protein COB93_08225 [Sneathiella sp.]|nr:MAG: hypothetical protein COB93_08225 [Sneathiella sp.]